MKVVVTLLIFGVLLAAIGVGLWVDSNNVLSLEEYCYQHFDVATARFILELGIIPIQYYEYKADKATEENIGVGLAVLGGGMAVSGWVMMIVKRRDYKINAG